MRSSLLLIAIVASAFLSSAQRYSYVQYSTEQGLPQSQVTSICQDDDGYLWVGTFGGLAKFNGGKFTTYSANNGLLNNRVTAVEFFDNTVWVGHDGGISCLKNNEITTYPFTGIYKSRGVSEILRFNNKILICSSGGGLFELKNNKLNSIALGEEEGFLTIRGALEHEKTLYLATKKGILFSKNASNFSFYEELDSLSFSGVVGDNDNLYFTSYSEGVFVRNNQDGEWKTFTREQILHKPQFPYLDDSGNLWLASSQGVIRLDEESDVSFYNEENGLPVNNVSCFYQDNDGYVWVGSQGKGVLRFPGTRFEYYDRSSGFSTDLFLGGFQKRNNEYFFATYGRGVIRKNGDGQIGKLPIEGAYIWSTLRDVDNCDWFGTEASLVRMDGAGNVSEYTDINIGLPGLKITAMYKIDDHSMYIGGTDGVSIYENGKFRRIGDLDPYKLGTVRDFELVDDSLFCVSNLGLFIYKNGDFVPYKGIQRVIYNLEKDRFGNLWFGTEEGLYRMRKGKVERIELLDDPASNYINFMNYKNGQLFVGSNNGLFIINSLNSNIPHSERYGIGDGLVELETNINSGFFDNEDRFWFGTASGLVCYHPNSLEFKQSRPNINLSKILLNYADFNYLDYCDELDEKGLPKDLVLPYSKNSLMFEMDGIALVNHAGLSYQFWLEGLNEDWSPLTDNSTISFTGLPAGTYTLRMRSTDIDGQVSDEISFSFKIEQAYYKTWWFIAGCTFGISLLVLLAFRLRLRRVHEKNEKDKLSYKARLLSLEQKSINASMNRHFIFNALNSIQYFINRRDKLSANRYLTDFAKLIRQNLDTANLEGNTISLNEEIERMRLYLSLESMRFKDRFDYDIDIASDIDEEGIKIPAMLMQPFIENSIIHGILPNENKKGFIQIDFYKEEGYLFIAISDNGIGVKESLSKKSGVDGDHKSQGMEITSKRIELIQKLSSFDISLIGPEEVYDENRLINGTRVLIKMRRLDFDY